MDIEWLLSTLFDASLLSPSRRRQRRRLFLSRNEAVGPRFARQLYRQLRLDRGWGRRNPPGQRVSKTRGVGEAV